MEIVNVSFALQFKGGETAMIAVISLQCLGVVVETVVTLDRMSEKFRSTIASGLADSDTRHDAIACLSLKSFRVNLDESRCLLAVQQPLNLISGECQLNSSKTLPNQDGERSGRRYQAVLLAGTTSTYDVCSVHPE